MKNMQVLKKELIAKAMHCKNAEELMALAESEGISLTKEEAKRIWLKWKTWNWTGRAAL